MAEVYGTFYDGHGSTYLVMEHLDPSSFLTAITEAVAWLLTCPLSDAGRIGLLGQAPVPFVDAAALEAHVNEVRSAPPLWTPTDRISLADQPLIFMHSDITLDTYIARTTSSAIHRHRGGASASWTACSRRRSSASISAAFTFRPHHFRLPTARTPTRSYARAISPCPPCSPLRLSLCRAGTRRSVGRQPCVSRHRRERTPHVEQPRSLFVAYDMYR
ncbi:hypothetical protein C8R45DRAFT_1043394 [Mycena sanguinolenta]|nr:hypothetical protein C8R45DRAFT_1043394 [Mycena sanguinolenta]